jgi:hypothetical protein
MERINSRIDEEFCQEAWDVVNGEEKINSINSEATPENAATLLNQSNQSAENLGIILEDCGVERNLQKQITLDWRTYLVNQGAHSNNAIRGGLFDKVVEKHIKNLSLFTDDRFQVCFQTPCNRF